MPLHAPIDRLMRDAPILTEDMSIREAVRVVLECDLAALPVADARGRPIGVFGEREFIGALFPAYIKELRGAAFVRGELDEALERRTCAQEPVSRHMTTERVAVRRSGSAVQLVETFLHHRVSVVPVVSDEDRTIVGVVTRSDFFDAIAQRFLSPPDDEDR